MGGMMTVRDSLAEAVTLLTREHPVWVERENPDGSLRRELHRVPSLLDQLREAAIPGREGGSGVRTDGSPAPVALNALDLMCAIEDETAQQYWLVRDATRRLGGYTLAERIRYWASRVESDELLARRCGRVLWGWVRDIAAVFEPPPKPLEVRGRCRACGEEYQWVEVDGERVRRYALEAFVDNGGPVLRCGACGTVWDADLMPTLEEASEW